MYSMDCNEDQARWAGVRCAQVPCPRGEGCSRLLTGGTIWWGEEQNRSACCADMPCSPPACSVLEKPGKPHTLHRTGRAWRMAVPADEEQGRMHTMHPGKSFWLGLSGGCTPPWPHRHQRTAAPAWKPAGQLTKGPGASRRSGEGLEMGYQLWCRIMPAIFVVLISSAGRAVSYPMQQLEACRFTPARPLSRSVSQKFSHPHRQSHVVVTRHLGKAGNSWESKSWRSPVADRDPPCFGENPELSPARNLVSGMRCVTVVSPSRP